MPGFEGFGELVFKLFVAIVLGGVIGWERETHDRPAGLRTHVLVCVGSAVYMILSMSWPTYQADPTRIAAQVATGMGFLGAGTIIRHGSAVRGLTTAASLWAIAAIGLCVGRGASGYMIAITTTLFVFVILRGLSWVEHRMLAKRQFRHLVLRVRNARELLPQIQAALDDQGVRVQSYEISEADLTGIQEVRLSLRLPPNIAHSKITLSLTALEDVFGVDWD